MIKITTILLVLTVVLALVHGALAAETPNATITPAPTPVSAVFGFSEEVVKGVQREGFTIMQMVKTPEYTASAIAVKPEIKMHSHPDGNHVIYIVNGSGTGILDGKSYALKPGTIVHIPKGSIHNIKAEGGEMQILDFARPPFDPAKIEWITPTVTTTPGITQTPGEQPRAVPAFSSPVIPIAVVIGLVVLLRYKRRT